MSRRGRRAAATALLAAALLSSCGEPAPSQPPGESDVDVATPSLVRAKQQAGVEPCRPGPGQSAAGQSAVGQPGAAGLPDLTLPCFGGGDPVNLASLRGPMVVNLWASWCGPCRTEMPVLQRFHTRYGDRVPLLGIDFADPQTEAAMALVQDTGVTYPLLADPGADLQGASPFPARMGLPLFAFVAADGTVSLVAGGVDSVAKLVALVEQQLGVTL